MLPVFPIMALSGPLFTEMNDGEAQRPVPPVLLWLNHQHLLHPLSKIDGLNMFELVAHLHV